MNKSPFFSSHPPFFKERRRQASIKRVLKIFASFFVLYSFPLHIFIFVPNSRGNQASALQSFVARRMHNLDLFHTFINTPSKVVESNIRALVTSLEKTTVRTVPTCQCYQDQNEATKDSLHVKYVGSQQANQSSMNTIQTRPSIQENNAGTITDSKQQSKTNISDMLNGATLEKHVDGERKQSGKATLKQKSKSFTSQRDRFFELKADMSRQDVIDQELRIMTSRRHFRSQSVPENVMMISGRGRYPRALKD